MAEPQEKKKRVGEILLAEGLINEWQLAAALADQSQFGGRLGTVLLRLGFIKEEDLAYALQARLGIKWLSLRELQIHEKVVQSIPVDSAKKLHVMPVTMDDKTITVALNDPTDLKTLDTLSFVTGKKIRPVIALESDIAWAISKYYDKAEDADKKPVPPKLVLPPAGGEQIARGAERPQAGLKVSIGFTLEAIVALLIEKGVITREELAKKIGEKQK